MGIRAGPSEAPAAGGGLVGGAYRFVVAHRELFRVLGTAARRWWEKPRFLSGPYLPMHLESRIFLGQFNTALRIPMFGKVSCLGLGRGGRELRGETGSCHDDWL